MSNTGKLLTMLVLGSIVIMVKPEETYMEITFIHGLILGLLGGVIVACLMDRLIED